MDPAELKALGLGLPRVVVRLAHAEPAWLVAGQRLVDEVRSVLRDRAAEVEHIGSTAVPGLLCKPIVDIAVRLAPAATQHEVVVLLQAAGWTFRELLRARPAPRLCVMITWRGRGGVVRSLTMTMVLLGACGDTADRDASYFAIRAVMRESPPPCSPPALSEQRDGQALRCIEVGPVAVDASDVASAAVVATGPGTEAVQFDLSPKGTERFNALARSVGLGGRAAIVVDGVVVSAPRFETTEFAGQGHVTGLDAASADRLARRLNRH